MISYQKYINEVGDRPLKWRWTLIGKQYWKAEFRIDDKVYTVIFQTDMFSPGEWSIRFHFVDQKTKEAWHTSLSRTGNEIQVYSTVQSILKEFIKKKNPPRLVFAASIGGKSRVSLYRRVWNKPPAGYKKEGTEIESGNQYFYWGWK